jgi:hypothetical protein
VVLSMVVVPFVVDGLRSVSCRGVEPRVALAGVTR